MNKSILTVIFTGLGLTGGALIGYKFAKKKFEKLADEEVESVKKSLTEHYDILLKAAKEEKKEVKKTTNKPLDDKKDVKKPNIIPTNDNPNKDNYVDYGKQYRNNYVGRIVGVPGGETIKKEGDAIYVISPEEFNESDFSTQTLFYYTDKVLADEDNNQILDIPGNIGNDSLTRFGEFEDDVVYVRNEILGIDFEVLLDERKFHRINDGNGDDE